MATKVTLERLVCPKLSCAIICCFRPSFGARLNAAKIAKVIKPKPPDWMSNKIINCPKWLNDSLRFTTDKPVIVTAEVAVNKASIQLTLPLLAKGSFNNIVPSTIKLRKPIANNEGGLRLNIFWEFIFIAIL